ncbi:MAG: putative multicopper oxidase [Chloroflexi bacterium]|nr:putative multicopper oxidase [Chloroflexota bacterium]
MLRRRDLLKRGVIGGSAAYLAWRFPSLMPPARAGRLEPFSLPLPIPPVLQPVRRDASGDFYELTMKSGRAQLRDGAATEIWGYDGIWPGPTIRATRGRPTHVRATNLMSRDVNIHNHGHKVPVESDGGPLDVIHPGESRAYVYPNDQNASTYWYHDHTMGNAESIYRGMAGFYLITDPAEDALNLPSGEYDIPLMIQDRTLDGENRLTYGLNEKTIEEGTLGDTLFVNGVAMPHMEVANRKYRFRFLGAANRRTLGLRLGDGDPMIVIGSDGGLLEAPVSLSALPIFNGERWDVVIDFSGYPVGSSVVLHNTRGTELGLSFPPLLPDVMRFDIVRSEPDPSDVPSQLASVERLQPDDAVKTRRFVLEWTDGHWTINGRIYDPARIDAYPVLGTTETWEFENRSDQIHDLHLHLVQFQQLLGPDGQLPPPYRSGWKDTKRILPHIMESIIVPFDGYTGVYVFHCHMLEHAEHMMMGQFEVVGPEGPGASATQPNSSFVCPLPTSTRYG